MLIQAWWLSILPFQHFSYHPAPGWLLSLPLQLAFLPQQSLFPHNPQSIWPSLCCSRRDFLVVSTLQASFWIASCATIHGLGPILLPSRAFFDLLDDVVVLSTWSICRIYRLVVEKRSFSEHHHWILCWLCWWARCWMLQDMDHIEASCVCYVEVGMLNQSEQSKICVLKVTTLGIAMLNIHHDMMFGICCK